MKTEWQIGDIIQERWEVFDVKAGGMGVVYLCSDSQRCGDAVALKTMKPAYAHDALAQRRFVHEAMTWIDLRYHPNIAQAYSVEDVNGQPYIVVEYVDQSLREIIADRHVSWEVWLSFALQVCRGMDYASRRIPGFVHRDLKPENILWRWTGDTKVTDFGLAAVTAQIRSGGCDPGGSGSPGATKSILTSPGAIVGTPRYMSPEQCLGRLVDHRSDLYAFGCVLFEMLTGRPLFDAKTVVELLEMHISWSPRRLQQIDPQLPMALDTVVSRCLEKEPRNRYQTWQELIAALSVLCGEAIEPPQPAAVDFDRLAAEHNEEMRRLHESLSRPASGFQVTEWSARSVTAQELEGTALFNEAVSCIHLGQYAEALRRWDRVVQVWPECAEAWVNRGATLSNYFGRHDEALDCFETALRWKPDLANAWFCKGIVLKTLLRFAGAAASFEQALQLGAPGATEQLADCRRRVISST